MDRLEQLSCNTFGTIWSMCFISRKHDDLNKDFSNPIIGMIVHRKGAVLNELLLLEFDTEKHTGCILSQCIEPGPLALNILEVPNAPGFALISRAGDFLLMDFTNPSSPSCIYQTSLNTMTVDEDENSMEESLKDFDPDEEGMFNVAACALLKLRESGIDMAEEDDPMSIDSECYNVLTTDTNLICSSCWEPTISNCSRLTLCLDSGQLFMINFYLNREGVGISFSDCLYKGSPCKVLLWGKSDLLVAIVEMGDGMVLKLEDGEFHYISPIGSVAPTFDIAVMDSHDETKDQIFACCGMGVEGSLRVIQSGDSVERLLKTPPIYHGITATWALRMKKDDLYHSFLVLSFVEETRVLSVGLSFVDVTDAVGFNPGSCTLACGLVMDGLLVQVYRNAVQLCLPTMAAHPAGIPLSTPICTSWVPNNMTISLGAIGHNLIVVSTSNPCFLFILGIRSLSAYHYEIYQIQRVRLQYEVSCIFIPKGTFVQAHSTSVFDNSQVALPFGIDICRTFVIGTHKPSVEILSFTPELGFQVLAVGVTLLPSIIETSVSGCIPQDVHLVLVDRFYILSGLRNGMLLRFEWPTVSSVFSSESSIETLLCPYLGKVETPSLCFSDSIRSSGKEFNTASVSKKPEYPVNLQLIAMRQIGITPVFLIPLNDALDADMIVLSDRPWLLHSARRSLAHTSISFQRATHATAICSVDCPHGILYVADNSLHLVEMNHSRRLNVQKFPLGSTPRKILYHIASKALLIMRTKSINDSGSSDICLLEPTSGLILSTYSFDKGETPKCMQFVMVGDEQVLVVGTSLHSGSAILPNGEAESAKGRIIVIRLNQVSSGSDKMSSSDPGSTSPGNTSLTINNQTGLWWLQQITSTTLSGIVLSISQYLHRFLASAGNNIYLCALLAEKPQRLRKILIGRTRFTITSLTTYLDRIVVGDCRDGILFYSYQEDSRKLELIQGDPEQRLVAECTMVDKETVFVSDRRGTISVLKQINHLDDTVGPECNLKLCCSYYIGETVISIRKGLFFCKLPNDIVLKKRKDDSDPVIDLSHNSIVASTLLGSVVIIIPILREEYELLEAVQGRLINHPLTAPILGNDHREFRSQGSLAKDPKILDGDMLAQFLELTTAQQHDILSYSVLPSLGYSTVSSSQNHLTANQVIQLLEGIHYVLN